MWLWLSETQFHHAHPSPFPSFLKLFLSAWADSLHVEQLCNLASSFTLRLHVSLTLHEELLQYIQDPTRDLFYNHMPFSRHCYNLFECFLCIKLTPVSFLTFVSLTLEKCSTMLLPLAKIVAGNKILLYSFIPWLIIKHKIKTKKKSHWSVDIGLQNCRLKLGINYGYEYRDLSLLILIHTNICVCAILYCLCHNCTCSLIHLF